jgi:hypothetical protein
MSKNLKKRERIFLRKVGRRQLLCSCNQGEGWMEKERRKIKKESATVNGVFI